MSPLKLVPLAIVFSILSSAPSLARGNDLEIKTGGGEEIKIENGWFGRKNKVVKDRFGNKFEEKKGVLGGKEQEVSIMGQAATIKRKKGLFGSSTIEGSTIFGDKVTTKKGWFGRRKTSIDVSGSAGMIGALVGKKSQPAATSSSGVTKTTPVFNDIPAGKFADLAQ